jgi:hypothetical protein
MCVCCQVLTSYEEGVYAVLFSSVPDEDVKPEWIERANARTQRVSQQQLLLQQQDYVPACSGMMSCRHEDSFVLEYVLRAGSTNLSMCHRLLAHTLSKS